MMEEFERTRLTLIRVLRELIDKNQPFTAISKCDSSGQCWDRRILTKLEELAALYEGNTEYIDSNIISEFEQLRVKCCMASEQVMPYAISNLYFRLAYL